MFSFLKPKKNGNDGINAYRNTLVDGLFYMAIPVGWDYVESDRFRTSTKDGNTLMSVTNYGKKNEKGNEKVSKELLKEHFLPLFEDYCVSGGYEPYNDLECTDEFIAQSFKVDEETQYYIATMTNHGDSFIITNIIIRDIGDYKQNLWLTQRMMVKSMRWV